MREKNIKFSALLRKPFFVLIACALIWPELSQAGPPKCFLHGMIRSRDGSEKPSVSDMIRLHFDAGNRKKCETMIHNYCLFNVMEKQYTPVDLKGSFKPDVDKDKEYIYGFNPKCKLLNDDEE